MAKFAYNNIKNRSTSYTSFELNYKYHLYVFYKEDINSYLKSCLAKKVIKKLKDLMLICQ